MAGRILSAVMQENATTAVVEIGVICLHCQKIRESEGKITYCLSVCLSVILPFASTHQPPDPPLISVCYPYRDLCL